MSARIGPAAVSLGVALAASGAGAYTRGESQWNPATLPISYRVNVSSIPASLGSAGLAAVDGGMATWAAPTCTRWRAANGGTTARTSAQAGDRENSILWLSGAWPAELGSVNVTIGVTTPVWNSGGYFIDADIQFNNVGFAWNTTGAGRGVDAQSIATHEEGHFLGLNHTTVRGAVMLASYSGGTVRNLSADDIAGVCALYPSGGPVPDAGVPTDPCAAFSSCAGCTPNAACGWCPASNRCATGTSSGPVSGACGAGWTWDPRACTAAPVADAGPAADPCARNAACGTCTPVNGCGWCGATNRCVSGTQRGPVAGTCGNGYAWLPQDCTTPTTPAGTAVFGEPCRQPADCTSGGLCVTPSSGAAFCSRVCLDDCSCPRDYTCNARLRTGQLVCVPGTNRCDTPAPDAGPPPPPPPPPADAGEMSDVSTPPDDASAPPDDDGKTMSTPDAAPTTDAPRSRADADEPAPTYPTGGSSSGCGCRAPGESPSPSPFLALALGALVTRRRARR